MTKEVKEALKIAFEYGQIDGSHHRLWAIDQMVRALTGKDYEKWVEEYEEVDPDTGESEYFWEEGIAP